MSPITSYAPQQLVGVAPRSFLVAIALAVASILAACDALEGEPEFAVTAYEGATITAESSPGWAATVADGVITLKGEGRAAWRGLQEDEVVFIKVAPATEGLLPRLVDVWVGVANGPGDVLERAELGVQEWSVPGVVSGRLTGSHRTRGYEFEFWVEVE